MSLGLEMVVRTRSKQVKTGEMGRKVSGCSAWKVSEILFLIVELVSSFKILLDKSSKMRSEL